MENPGRLIILKIRILEIYEKCLQFVSRGALKTEESLLMALAVYGQVFGSIGRFSG